MTVDSVEVSRHFVCWHHGTRLATFFIAPKNCIFAGTSFEPIKNLATLVPEKLQDFHGNPLYHCYTLAIGARTLCGIRINYHRGKGSVNLGDWEQVWICARALWHSVAGKIFVWCVATHHTNSNWIWIHRTRIMKTCRVLYLSDSSEGLIFVEDFPLLGISDEFGPQKYFSFSRVGAYSFRRALSVRTWYLRETDQILMRVIKTHRHDFVIRLRQFVGTEFKPLRVCHWRRHTESTRHYSGTFWRKFQNSGHEGVCAPARCPHRHCAP